MSGCVDELHPKGSGGFYGDVTTLFAGFCDVIYVWMVKITSPRNLRVIYGVNRNLATKSGYADELHLTESGWFYGDATAVYAGFCDVIYVWLVKITSPRNLRVIYGVNRNLVRRSARV